MDMYYYSCPFLYIGGKMKKLININLTILISVVLIVLGVSLCIKDVIINSINSEIVAKEVSSKVISILKEYDISYEDLEKIETNIINFNIYFLFF